MDTGVCSNLKCKNIAASTLRRICINAELIHKIVRRLTLQKELGMLMRKPTHPLIGHVQLLRKMDQHVVKSVFHVNILHSICEDSMGQDGIAVVEKISNGRLPNIITKRVAHHAYPSKPKREGRTLCSRNCNFCILLTLVYFLFSPSTQGSYLQFLHFIFTKRSCHIMVLRVLFQFVLFVVSKGTKGT